MAFAKQVLLIDDGMILWQVLGEQTQLRTEFVVVGAKTGAEALELAKANRFDVVVLGAGRPGADGHEICRLLRGRGIAAPIIMLTDADAVRNLDAEVDGYIIKPFRFNELLTQIRMHIGRREGNGSGVFIIGSYVFQPGAKLLVSHDNEKKVRLTDKEVAILKYLYRAGATIISREVLLDEVWGYNAGVTTHTLETHIYRLRRKIEIDPSMARVLITEQGGYRLAP